MSNQCLLKYCKYSKEFYIISFDLAVWQLQLFYEVTRANRKKKKKKATQLRQLHKYNSPWSAKESALTLRWSKHSFSSISKWFVSKY